MFPYIKNVESKGVTLLTRNNFTFVFIVKYIELRCVILKNFINEKMKSEFARNPVSIYVFSCSVRSVSCRFCSMNIIKFY